MFRNYDFAKAKRIIEENKNEIVEASLGMHEDWFWTAQDIYKDGQYTREFPNNPQEIYKNYIEKRKAGMRIFSDDFDQFECIMIGGIFGSDWATPTLQLIFKDGVDKMIPCFEGVDERSEDEKILDTALKQASLLGCLSGPAQDRISPLSKD